MAREHALSWHRLFLVAVIVGLAVVALLALRGPDWYQRLYHPLDYAPTIGAEAGSAGLDPYLVAAVINVESGFRSGAVSDAGAVGLMQIKPSTARAVAAQADLPEHVDATTLLRPGTNIRVGTRYLGYLVRRYGGNSELALAAYNAGMKNADRWSVRAHAAGTSFNDSIAFPATRHYVDEVVAQAAVYRRLYPQAFDGK